MKIGLFVSGSRAAALSNAAPTDIALSAATLAENSAQGTVIGTLSVTDPDVGDSVTFTLIDDAGGRFQVSGSSLQAGAVATDYETSTSHNITVRATDAAGATYSEVFAITVTDVEEFTEREFMAFGVMVNSTEQREYMLPGGAFINEG